MLHGEFCECNQELLIKLHRSGCEADRHKKYVADDWAKSNIRSIRPGKRPLSDELKEAEGLEE